MTTGSGSNRREAKGLVVIIDLHWNVRVISSCVEKEGDLVNAFAPDDFSVVIWQEIAALYKDDPGVVFELFNEPSENLTTTDTFEWKDGGSVSSNGNDWISPGHQALYDAIRNQGAWNLVIADALSNSSACGSTGASDLRFLYQTPDSVDDPGASPGKYALDGTNIAYAYHVYGATGLGQGVPAYLATCVDPALGGHGYSVFNTEFGSGNSNPVTATLWFQNVTHWAENRDHGWIGFAWNNSSIGRLGLLDGDLSEGSLDYSPNAQGKRLLAQLD